MSRDESADNDALLDGNKLDKLLDNVNKFVMVKDEPLSDEEETGTITLANLNHVVVDVDEDTDMKDISVPVKKRKLAHTEAAAPHSSPSGASSSNHVDGAKEPRYAYVTLIYGKESEGYCIDAAVLAHSLKPKTRHKLVLMHTKDVPRDWLKILEDVGWELRPVRYIWPGDPWNPNPREQGKRIYKGGRFSGVFTKIHCLNLIEFDKIIFLDTDLLVRESIDHLFERKAPAALRRQARGDCPDDTKIDGNGLYFNHGALAGGINAGVMLLKPKESDYRNIKQAIRIEDCPAHSPSTQPEQDFLTKWYMDEWWSLGVQYNYQLHQFAYCVRPGNENGQRLRMSYDDVYVVHYSAEPKPSTWLLGSTETKEQFIKTITENYKGLLRREQKFHKCAAQVLRNVKVQLAAVVQCSCEEWYRCWDSLVAAYPRIHDRLPREPNGDDFSSGRRQRSASPHSHIARLEQLQEQKHAMETALEDATKARNEAEDAGQPTAVLEELSANLQEKRQQMKKIQKEIFKQAPRVDGKDLD